MQLNFLQEDLAAALQKTKKSATTKNIPKLSISNDLFSGLPLAMPLESNPEIQQEIKSAEKPTQKLCAEPIAELPRKSHNAFKTISEVSAILEVPQHVLRFWESRFSQIKPLKMSGGRRYYRPEDIDVLSKIQNLLYKQGYTIKGAKKAFNGKDVAKENIPEEIITTSEVINATPKEKTLNDKQKKQVAALLKELLSLRETLRPYLVEPVTA